MSISRDSDEVRLLLTSIVPEIASGAVEIVGIAREKGKRVMIAVHTLDENVDPVGSCVGSGGERIRSLIRALPGDKIDVVLWCDSEDLFLRNLLAPAKVLKVAFDAPLRRATVSLHADDVGRFSADGGARLRLASRLFGWEIQLGDP